jgi:hypothetical protein
LFLINFATFTARSSAASRSDPPGVGTERHDAGALAPRSRCCAIVGVPLGRMADRMTRKPSAGGVFVWSVLTGMSGVARTFGHCSSCGSVSASAKHRRRRRRR